MPAPLPEALRARFQKLIEEGLSGRAAALRLKVSPATGARWRLAIRQMGATKPAAQGRPRGKGKLDPHREFLLEAITQDGKRCDDHTIWAQFHGSNSSTRDCLWPLTMAVRVLVSQAWGSRPLSLQVSRRVPQSAGQLPVAGVDGSVTPWMHRGKSIS